MPKTIEKLKVDDKQIAVVLYRCGGCNRALDVSTEPIVKETAVFVLIHPDGSQETFHDRNADDATWTEFWCVACFGDKIPYVTETEKRRCAALVAAYRAIEAAR